MEPQTWKATISYKYPLALFLCLLNTTTSAHANHAQCTACPQHCGGVDSRRSAHRCHQQRSAEPAVSMARCLTTGPLVLIVLLACAIAGLAAAASSPAPCSTPKAIQLDRSDVSAFAMPSGLPLAVHARRAGLGFLRLLLPRQLADARAPRPCRLRARN